MVDDDVTPSVEEIENDLAHFLADKYARPKAEDGWFTCSQIAQKLKGGYDTTNHWLNREIIEGNVEKQTCQGNKYYRLIKKG